MHVKHPVICKEVLTTCEFIQQHTVTIRFPHLSAQDVGLNTHVHIQVTAQHGEAQERRQGLPADPTPLETEPIRHLIKHQHMTGSW